MKNKILLICSVFFLFACQPDTNSNQASMVDTGKNNEKTNVKHVEASILAPLIGSWEFTAAVNIKDKAERAAYIGRWFDLKGDQTFTCGLGADQVNSGQWTYDGETKIISFVFDKEEIIATEFEIQGIGTGSIGPDTVIFKGNTPNNPKGMQVKVVRQAKSAE